MLAWDEYMRGEKHIINALGVTEHKLMKISSSFIRSVKFVASELGKLTLYSSMT